jgi:hypothetical protein
MAMAPRSAAPADLPAGLGGPPLSVPPQQALIRVVERAVEEFNRGDVAALIPSEGRAARRRRACPDAALVAIEGRPVSISHISCVDARRVFCSLRTAHGHEVAGVYFLDHGRISQASHCFSDIDLLVSVGILQPGDADGALQAPRS